MVGVGNSNKSPKDPENPSKNRREIVENGQRNESLLSPGFRSVAAMAGWDEEALLIASLIVEDTPDRQFEQKKRSVFNNLKTPPTNSRRKRRARKPSPISKIPVGVLDLDGDEQKSKPDNEKVTREAKTNAEVGSQVLDLDEDEPKSKLDDEKLSREKKIIEEVEKHGGNEEVSNVSSSRPVIPCIDRLREELSCAICLEICYEPSTTPCGHSFCKKCLRSAADRCGKKCPKCRQLISNGRYCTVNTVLWNTIQLLFPQEVEARKAAAAAADSASGSNEQGVPVRTRSRVVEFNNGSDGAERRSSRSSRAVPSSRRDVRRTELPGQDEDAALALRLQREEFIDAFAVAHNNRRSSTTTARANLRAMASRAMNIRIRSRTDF